MIRKIRYLEPVLEELDSATVWQRDNRPPHVADAFLRAIFQAIEHLAEFPRAYPISSFDPRVRVRKLRSLSYETFYLASASTITVAAISHPSREPGYWLDRLP
ncbi:MAG TPA: type II toxin-antitoxin system RelE/ParE family toxin [Kofleriaceae bacterium]|nr:type II toxin-antitoxin system RelE/ParE family toxin [Kofleriaceae bacterium]